jgi:hypothetical protein
MTRTKGGDETMWAIKVYGRASGLSFILDSRFPTKSAAVKQLRHIERDQSYPWTTREVVKV